MSCGRPAPADDEFIRDGLFETAGALVFPLAVLLLAGVAFAAGLVCVPIGRWLMPRG